MEALDLTLPEDIERYRELQSVVDDITIALDGSTAVAGIWKRTFEDENLYPGVTKLKNEVIKLKEAESKAADEAERLAISDKIKTLFSNGVGAQIVADLDIQEEEFDLLIQYLTETDNLSSAAGTSITSFASQLTEAEEALDGVANAYKTMAEGGSLTIKQIDELLADYPDLIDYIEVENGQLTSCIKILLEKLEAYKANQIQALKTSKSTIEGLKEEAEALKLNIDLEYQMFRQRGLARGDTQSEIDKAWGAAGVYETNIAKMIAGYDEQLAKLNKQINLWENLDVTKIFVGEITIDNTDYDAKYQDLIKKQELVEQQTERMSRMEGDFSEEQIQMWKDLRKAIIEKMAAVEKGSDAYHYLEDMLWEVNDAIEEVYDNQADAIQNIIDLTREMIEEEYEDAIDAIEKQTDAYNDLVEAKKKALRVDKETNDYNKKVAEKTKDIAKLQSRIAILSLDDSREAQAEKAALEEELAKTQGELADIQADHALEVTENALDESAEAHEKANDKIIDGLKETLDDEEALYKEAIDRIGNMEQSFYQNLEKWAKAHGKDIRELASDWDVAKNAKKGYTDLDAAMSGIAGNKDSLGALDKDGSYGEIGGNASGVGTSGSYTKPTGTLRKNATYTGSDVAWVQDKLRKWQEETTGVATLPITGNFWTETEKAVRAFQKAKGCKLVDGVVGPETLKYLEKYHTGGIVGGHGSLRDNELMSILEKNEIVMANGHKMNLSSLFDNLRNTIGELVSGNLMRSMDRMRAPIPAGGDTIAPQINVTIQHNGTMSDSDAKKYGSMVGDEAIKKLHEAFIKRGK